MPEGAVYIGRPSKYGNPYTVGQKLADDAVPNGYIIVDEATCLELFEYHVRGELMDDERWLEPLRGKDLACWCKEGAACHGDVLLRLIEETPAPPATTLTP
jgi:hypothetical protein